MAQKVIVIDDEYAIASLLFQHLLKKGFDVMALASGTWLTEGLIKTDGVDLIITDYHMPEIDGKSIIEYLRRQGYRGKILLSSSVDVSRIEDMKVDAVIEKPYTLEEFTKVIEGLL